MSYLENRELTPEQIEELRDEEKAMGWGREELLAILEKSLSEAEAVVRAIHPAALTESRAVGTQKTADHRDRAAHPYRGAYAQRHVGQAISACKWSRVIA